MKFLFKLDAAMGIQEVEYFFYIANTPGGSDNNANRGTVRVEPVGGLGPCIRLVADFSLDDRVCLLLYAAGVKGAMVTNRGINGTCHWLSIVTIEGVKPHRTALCATLRDYVQIEDILRLPGMMLGLLPDSLQAAVTEDDTLFHFRAMMAGLHAPDHLKEEARRFALRRNCGAISSRLSQFSQLVLAGAAAPVGKTVVHIGERLKWIRDDEFTAWTVDWALARPGLKDEPDRVERPPPDHITAEPGFVIVPLEYPRTHPRELGLLVMARDDPSGWTCIVVRGETDHFQITNFICSGMSHYAAIAAIMQ